MNLIKIINYWIKSAAKDWEVAKSLYRQKHYLHSLFFSQLVIEKILKALVVKVTKTHAPYTHNLVELAKRSKLSLVSHQLDFLDQLTNFNLEARYPDFKLRAYKKATPKLTKQYLSNTKKMFLWLKNQL